MPPRVTSGGFFLKGVDMNKVNKVAMDIGYFFYQKAEGDAVAKVNEATKEIKDIGITEITLDGTVAVIKVMRPGLLIGRNGTTFNALKEYLVAFSDVEITDIVVVEDKVLPNLFSFQVALEDGDYDY